METLAEQESKAAQMTVSKQALKKAFTKAKQMLKSGTLANKKAIVQSYVKHVTMYKDKIVIELNVIDGYTITEVITRDEIRKTSNI